ncbi:unnamed protein product [Callosobruchus maculatus]|uniref:Major facilitator superfamily (MFS) profile domain-containing protein n=1 Tax=Callosobruchus maculatus TaxID=64391 RepID=A0A653DSF0_CALMS|nr:unnamed protein product [Callosobruchus maculatus]
MENIVAEVESLRKATYGEEDVLDRKENNVQEKGTTLLFVSIAAVNLITLGTGCHIAWTSPTIPRLVSNDTSINPLGNSPATVFDISFIAGSYFIGCLVGNLIPARVLDRCGRKPVMALVAALMSVSSIVLAFASNVWSYCLCRLVLGIGSGATFMLIPLYTGEVAHKGNRGRFNYYLTMFLGLGFIYSYSTGSRFSTKVYTLLCSLPTLLALLFILLVIPETPYFLVSRNRTRSEVGKVLSKLRSCFDLEDEMKQIECAVSRNLKQGGQKVTYVSIFRDRATSKAFTISTSMLIFQLLSGTTVIYSFLSPILDTVTATYWSGNTSAIAISMVNLLCTITGSLTVERCGRKPLLIWSALTAGFSNFLLGVFFQLQALRYDLVSLSSLPFVCIVLYSIGYSLGLGSLPFAYVSELFPQHTKNVAVPVCTALGTLCNALLTVIFPYFMQYLGVQWCFWLFAASCVGCAIFTRYVVPETKGKTLEEIQRILEA